MSLLQEALKRQEAEKRATTPASAEPPPMPVAPAAGPSRPLTLKADAQKPAGTVPPPASRTPQSASHAHDALAKGVVLGGALLLVAILATLYVLLGDRGSSESDTPEPPRLVERLRTVEATVQSSRPAEEALPEIRGERAPEPAATPDPLPSTAPPTEESMPATEETPATQRPAAETTPVEGERAVTTVRWPDVRIQAAMGQGDRGSVMISGSLVPVGDAYNGVRILEITDRGVRLEYEGEQRLVPVRR